ncbi:MAG: Ig-like domain-containing protein [Vicinamibacterales bacterium]
MRTRAIGLVLAAMVMAGMPAAAWAQGALANGENHTGTITFAGEVQVWTFTANQGDAIELSIGERVRVPDSGFWPWIRLYGPTNALIGGNFNYGDLVAQISATAPLTGTYTVWVASADSGNDALGDYTLTLARMPGTFGVSAGDQGGTLGNGVNQAGRIEVGDLDVWTFDANQNDAIELSIGEVPVGSGQPDPGFWPWIRLYGPTGALMGGAFNYGNLVAQISATAPLTGSYTVVVGTADSGHDAVGDYLLRLARIPGTFTVPTGDDGGALTNGANHAGFIDIGDLDIWSFTANQNDAINLSIGEVPVGPGQIDPGFWPWIRLYGPQGNQIGGNFNYGDLVAQIAATASLTGTYTVVVGTADSGHDATGDYLLRLVKTPGSFVVPTGDEGGPLANGDNHSGHIGIGDLDAWSFAAAKDDAIELSIGEVPVPSTQPDPGFWPWIRLYGPTGALIGGNFNYGDLVAQISATAPLTGTYTVVVGTADSGHDAVGDYLLRLAKVPGAFTVPTGDHGGPMANNTPYTGRIEIGDLDMWSFHASQSAALNVTINEIPVGSGQPDPGFWPWIRLYGPTGALIGGSFHYGDLTAQITATAPLTGTYVVIVTTADSGHDATGDYTLKVIGASQPPVPISAPDTYTTTLNTPLVVPPLGVMTNDQNINGATVAVVTGVNTGVLSLNPNGGFTYTPQSGFTGLATFTYRATNAAGPGNVATVTITVQTPQAPVAAPDTYTATSGQTLTVATPGVLGNDSPNGGGALTAFLVATASHGTLALNANGSFAYTPAANFAGQDTFTYRASNTNGFSNVATVTVNVASSVTPAPPSGLYAWSIVGNVVTLRWTAPSGPAPTNYLMDGGIAPGAPLVSIPTGRTEPVYVFTVPNGSFYVRIRAIVNGSPTGPSNEIRIHVNVPVAPSAPAGLTGTVNGSAVALSWRNTFAGGTPQTTVLDVSGTLSGSLPIGPADSFTFNGIPGGTYTFSVRSANAAGTSGSSNAVTLTFPQVCTGAPATPANFLAFKTGNLLTLLWDPAATGDATTQFVLNVSGAISASVPFNTRRLSVPVPPGSYTFSVAAVNACGTSPATPTQTVVIP